jgi:Fe2+ transport system protein FeoA
MFVEKITEPITLDKAKRGANLTILYLPSDLFKIQLIRLGITEGTKVYCMENLPGGTIVIQKNRQEIAIGYDLAKKIIIKIDE